MEFWQHLHSYSEVYGENISRSHHLIDKDSKWIVEWKCTDHWTECLLCHKTSLTNAVLTHFLGTYSVLTIGAGGRKVRKTHKKFAFHNHQSHTEAGGSLTSLQILSPTFSSVLSPGQNNKWNMGGWQYQRPQAWSQLLLNLKPQRGALALFKFPSHHLQ